MSLDPNQETPSAEEKQLCVSCLVPNEPAAHFCVKCGAPLSSYAATGPFEHLFAEGSVYRQAAERPQKLIVVLGVWLIFGTMAFVGICIVAMSLSFQDSDIPLKIIFAVPGLAIVAFSATMIWKTTRNYLKRKRPNDHDV